MKQKGNDIPKKYQSAFVFILFNFLVKGEDYNGFKTCFCGIFVNEFKAKINGVSLTLMVPVIEITVLLVMVDSNPHL